MISTTSAAAAANVPSKRSAKDWSIYFSLNTKRWQQFADTTDLSKAELNPAFVDSIKTFQLGEQSEGKTLRSLASKYAANHNDPDYAIAIQQFIGEEQRHAKYMAQALQHSGNELFAKAWSDSLFRQLRKLCGWEVMVSVLLTAEIIAIAYYAALAQASSHPIAKQLFERILQDEAVHLQFHGEYLSRDRPHQFSLRWGLHRLFVGVVSLLVWHEHKHVLQHKFHSFGCFFKRCDTLLTNLSI